MNIASGMFDAVDWLALRGRSPQPIREAPPQHTEETASGLFAGVVIACLVIAALCWLVAPRCLCGKGEVASDVALAHVQVDALAASIDPATCDPCRLPEELRDPWNVRVDIRCLAGEVHVRSAGEDRIWYTADDVVSDVHARDPIRERCRAEP